MQARKKDPYGAFPKDHSRAKNEGYKHVENEGSYARKKKKMRAKKVVRCKAMKRGTDTRNFRRIDHMHAISQEDQITQL